MPQTDVNPAGTFAWLELATTEQSAAKSYYRALFGWEPDDQPMGPGQVYTTFLLGGNKVGACHEMCGEELSSGIPPHWSLYIACDDADDTAKRATELGGRVLMPPFDVAEHGRMTIIMDPQGAAFCVWQAKNHRGIQKRSEPGTLCWADLNTTDQEAAGKFYSQLFGWTLVNGPDGYLHIKVGEQFIGGIPDTKKPSEHLPPHWLPYIQVADCEVSSAKTAENGGKVHFGPHRMEGIGTFAVVADPQYAVFALWQPDPNAKH